MKEPAERYSSARAALDDVEQIAPPSPQATRAATCSWVPTTPGGR